MSSDKVNWKQARVDAAIGAMQSMAGSNWCRNCIAMFPMPKVSANKLHIGLRYLPMPS